MGFGGISIWQILIILLIVILLFGTKKLRNVGGDLGAAIKNFKKSVREGQAEAEDKEAQDQKQVESTEGRVIDAEVEQKEQKKA